MKDVTTPDVPVKQAVPDVPAEFAAFCQRIGATIVTNFSLVDQPNMLIAEWAGAEIITPGAGSAGPKSK